MQKMRFESAMARLAKRAELAGISPRQPGETIAEFAARLLNALDPEDDENDDIRFVVLTVVDTRSG